MYKTLGRSHCMQATHMPHKTGAEEETVVVQDLGMQTLQADTHTPHKTGAEEEEEEEKKEEEGAVVKVATQRTGSPGQGPPTTTACRHESHDTHARAQACVPWGR